MESAGRRAAPHVGRELELAHVLTAVSGPAGRGAIVAGQPGVGKSHLLGLVAETLTGQGGWRPLRARGDPTRTLPFGSLSGLLPTFEEEAERWAGRLRRGLDHLVAAAAPDRPLLVVDDLHAFDPASATLLQQAAMDGRFRVIGSLRTGTSVPDAVTALWKDDVVDRLDLGPLSRDEADQLVERLVGGPVDAETRTRLWQWVEGNPLLICEIVTQAQARGSWRRSAGLWHLEHGDSRQPLTSPTLAAILGERLADSPPAATDVVDVLALAGHLPVEVLQRLVGPEALGAAERARLTRSELRGDQPALLLDHPLYGELRRGALDEERTAELRNRVLDIYEQLDIVSPADATLLATWYVACDRSGPRTAEMLTLSAELAWAGNDPRVAVGLARRARQLHRDDRSDLVLINALARLGEVDELGEVAGEVTRSASSDRVRADAVLNHALALFQFENQPDEAERLLVAARPHISDRRWRAALTHQIAILRLQRGDVDAAGSLIEPLLDAPDQATVANATATMSPVLLMKGQVGEALAVAERGLGIVMGLGYEADGVDPLAMGELFVRMIDAWAESGRLVDAEQMAEGAIASLDKDADPLSRSFIAFEVGRIARLRGRPERASRWFREAANGFEAIRRDGFAAWSLAGLTIARAQAGDLDEARVAAEQCLSVPGNPIGLAGGEVDRSLAWVLVAAGDVDAAREAIDVAADRSLATSEVVHAAHALHDLVRLGAAERAAGRLRDIARSSDGRLVACFAAHLEATLAGDGDALAAAARGFEAVGCDLHAAEAWSQAAAVAHAAGDPRATGEARRQARRLVEACEGARTPLLDVCPDPPDLSGREAEIARLVADGMSRRDIAAQLVVSLRTVDSHLQRIYRKVGVRDREGLALVVREQDGEA
jgi:DNA-binding CsgD family transcriptional regulator/tetratricopeptide (TPR) repeat protein